MWSFFTLIFDLQTDYFLLLFFCYKVYRMHISGWYCGIKNVFTSTRDPISVFRSPKKLLILEIIDSLGIPPLFIVTYYCNRSGDDDFCFYVLPHIIFRIQDVERIRRGNENKDFSEIVEMMLVLLMMSNSHSWFDSITSSIHGWTLIYCLSSYLEFRSEWSY